MRIGTSCDMRRQVLTAAVFLSCLWSSATGQGRAPVAVEAVLGEPVGVGRVTFGLDSEDAIAWYCGAITVAERDGRVLYPVLQKAGLLSELQSRLDGELAPPPRQATLYFLFTGVQPLELRLDTSAAETVSVAPESRRVRHRMLFRRWWQEQLTNLKRRRSTDYPPIVETYLATLHARRFQLDIKPALFRPRPAGGTSSMIDLLLGRESMRLHMLQELAKGSIVPEAPGQPLPADFRERVPPPPAAAAVLSDDSVESIAGHVPANCFYIRFGRYANLLWFKKLLQEQGQALGRIVTLRSLEGDDAERIESQLAVKDLPFAELLGDKLVADVALIGRDGFIRDGAAVGILLQAKTALLLEGLRNVRSTMAASRRDATLANVTVAGHEVSLLSTPDNQLRSFLVTTGDYHLITNSRAIAADFLRLEDQVPSLADGDAFRTARATFPPDRDDALFVYLSREFCEGLLQPKYLIELERRTRAGLELQLVQLARFAYQAETVPAPPGFSADADDQGREPSLERLIDAGFLPPGFAERPDGSQPVPGGGQLVDSLRGARGTFLPVPDVDVELISENEARRCAQWSADRGGFSGFDPLVLAVRREPLTEVTDRERLAVELQIAPFERGKYGWLSTILGTPTRERIAAPANALVSLNLVLRRPLQPQRPDQQVLFSLLDEQPAADVRPGQLLATVDMLRDAPALLVAAPPDGLLNLRLLGRARAADVHGNARTLTGLHAHHTDSYSAVTFAPEWLDQLPPVLPMDAPESPAQLRVQAGDLVDSRLAAWLNALACDRALRASLNNVRLLHAVSNQLRVARPDARQVTEEILGRTLACPLSGDYKLVVRDGQGPRWTSTAWLGDTSIRGAADFQSALLDWFHGIDGSLLLEDGRLVVTATVDIRRDEITPETGQPAFWKGFKWGQNDG